MSFNSLIDEISIKIIFASTNLFLLFLNVSIEQKNIKNFYSTLEQENPKGSGAVKRRSIPKTLPEWSKLGFKTINSTDLPKRADLEARLVAPDGIDGRMFLVYPNYKNILYYNCSSYYALSIGLLSDEIHN
mgnify:CR=1 FL=1